MTDVTSAWPPAAAAALSGVAARTVTDVVSERDRCVSERAVPGAPALGTPPIIQSSQPASASTVTTASAVAASAVRRRIMT